ncbi:MAG: hypothetical protein PHW73_00435 [Atribacterota bacterium]|nr:hypothetical protein [Atribacterota bacterium]
MHSLIDIQYVMKTENNYRSGQIIINNDNGELVLTQPSGYSTDEENILGDTNVHMAPEKDHFDNDQINLVINFIDEITNANIDIYSLTQVQK